AGYNDLGEFNYTYDSSSNVLTADQAASLGELDVDRDYRYDTLDRLTHVDPYELQSFGIFWQAVYSTYDYDDLGNRETHIYRGGDHFLQQPTLAYEHDKANRMSKITGSGSYSGVSNPAYDKAGNQTFAYSSDRGLSYKYSYDHNNRLLAVHDNTGTTRKAAYTYDALGRRIEFINDVTGDTVRYYYDGVNEIVEANASGSELRHYVHGISYVDERLMMMRHDLADSNDDRPYYYVLDRQYNVWMVVDRAGAIVERYAYDPYGRPLIRESAGRGDMNNNTDVDGTDFGRYSGALSGSGWDPRADMNDDGYVNNNDNSLFTTALNTWVESSPTVSQAFSDVGNPFMFQGRPHFALDTDASATEGELMLNDHRARFNDPAIGRWVTRDPKYYARHRVGVPNLFRSFRGNAIRWLDPRGQDSIEPGIPSDGPIEPPENDDVDDPPIVSPRSTSRAVMVGCDDASRRVARRRSGYKVGTCCGCDPAIKKLACEGPFDVVELVEHGNCRWQNCGGLGTNLLDASTSPCDAMNSGGWLMLGGCSVGAEDGENESPICKIARSASCKSKSITVCGCDKPMLRISGKWVCSGTYWCAEIVGGNCDKWDGDPYDLPIPNPF
ncbi:MAG: hypothetical protein MI923_03550, partial [Phycisphaerales bacterium]|nr:hypothetical protein [Phycisphaerales bacterium]